jgi:hypothetical protein
MKNLAVSDWTRRTAVVICAGPSLSDEQLGAVAGRDTVRTIAVNTAYQYVPWADVVYGGDFMFWKVHHIRIRKTCAGARLVTQDNSASERFQLFRQRGGNREGLGLEVIHQNGNSGMQAINLAFLWGSRRILLIGMDMREIDGQKHRHGDHEKGLVQAQLFGEWIHKGKKLAEDLKAQGCEVVNCTPGSALPWFPMSTIEKELP